MVEVQPEQADNPEDADQWPDVAAEIRRLIAEIARAGGYGHILITLQPGSLTIEDTRSRRYKRPR